MAKVKLVQGSKNLFKDVGFTDLEAQDLAVRSRLMIMITKYAEWCKKDFGWPLADIAPAFNISVPRLKTIMSGKIDKVTTMQLIEMIEHYMNNID